MFLKESEVDQIRVAQDGDNLRSAVNTVMELHSSLNLGSFLATEVSF